jgi:hypothetical protein
MGHSSTVRKTNLSRSTQELKLRRQLLSDSLIISNIQNLDLFERHILSEAIDKSPEAFV